MSKKIDLFIRLLIGVFFEFLICVIYGMGSWEYVEGYDKSFGLVGFMVCLLRYIVFVLIEVFGIRFLWLYVLVLFVGIVRFEVRIRLVFERWMFFFVGNGGWGDFVVDILFFLMELLCFLRLYVFGVWGLKKRVGEERYVF